MGHFVGQWDNHRRGIGTEVGRWQESANRGREIVIGGGKAPRVFSVKKSGHADDG